MKNYLIYIVAILIIIVGYSILKNFKSQNNTREDGSEEQKLKQNGYVKITAEEMVKQTKDMKKEDYVIIDVRTKEEYNEERIPNSVLLPLDQIDNNAEEVLPDKDKKIYVYCRSGSRSRMAAFKLINLGYTDVIDFGGIMNYPYEKVKGELK